MSLDWLMGGDELARGLDGEYAVTSLAMSLVWQVRKSLDIRPACSPMHRVRCLCCRYKEGAIQRRENMALSEDNWEEVSKFLVA